MIFATIWKYLWWVSVCFVCWAITPPAWGNCTLFSFEEQFPFSVHAFYVAWTPMSRMDLWPLRAVKVRFPIPPPTPPAGYRDLFWDHHTSQVGQWEPTLVLLLALLGKRNSLCPGVAKPVGLSTWSCWRPSFPTIGGPSKRIKPSQRKAKLRDRGRK